MLSARAILGQYPTAFTHVSGDLECQASHCRSVDEARVGSLVFVSRTEHLAAVLACQPAIVVVDAAVTPSVPMSTDFPCCFLQAVHVRAAMGLLLQHFDGKAERFSQWGDQHPTAVVHGSAVIGRRVLLGPYCVIGARTVIGDDCRVGAHTVIENDALIGEGTTLHPHVFIGARCELGARCEIHPHSTVGSDGFAYSRDANGKPVKIAQVGIVKIGDDVEIGGNCSIDRATLTATMIRSGSKLDNLCHIAHNCDLGENGFYTAGFMMAGSTRIGKNFMTGGNSVVAGHLTIADNVELAGRSTVTNDVKEGGQYGGYPLQPLRDALKTLVSLGKLNEMRKKLNALAKR
jgi:UDP-3-O-[3-hydroxymyristoyl] glucosamine N-acyltransferase